MHHKASFKQQIKNNVKIQSAKITCVTSNFWGAQTFVLATRGCVDI